MMISLYQQHVNKWKNCQDCESCETRKRVVLARGVLPCDVLFVGEAPGESEDVLGKPFCGPAGKLLDEIVQSAIGQQTLRIAFTNIVACIPRVGGDKATEPSDTSIRKCRPRVYEITRIADPKLVILVGKLAECYFRIPEGMNFQIGVVTHPAAVLRIKPAHKELAIRRCVVQIETAIERAFHANPDQQIEKPQGQRLHP